MADFFEIHVLRPYGCNCLNRGENGEVKSITVGGDPRVRVSSPCIKHGIRDDFNGQFEKTYHTRYIAREMMTLAEAEGMVTDEDTAKSLRHFFDLLAIEKKDKGGKDGGDVLPETSADSGEKKKKSGKAAKKEAEEPHTDQLTAYSRAEVEAAVRFARTLGADRVASLMKETSLPKDLRASFNESLKTCSVGIDIALFGRMTTAGVGSTVPSSCHFNHEYSIDDNVGETDFFSAFDNLTGISGHLGTASIASNTLYGYMNCDPVQVYKNLTANIPFCDVSDGEKERMYREAREVAKRGIIELVKSYLYIHPDGCQTNKASYPVPSAVYMTVVRDGHPVTMDNAFNSVIRKYGSKGVAAIGAERMRDFILKDAPDQVYEYNVFFRDTATEREADLKDLESVMDVYYPKELNRIITTTLSDEIDRILEKGDVA